MRTRHVVLLSLAVAACNQPPASPATGAAEQAVWVNGDFEGDAIGTAPPTGWTTAKNVTPSGGLTDTRPSPQTLASLNLAAGGVLMTFVVGGAPESQIDPDVTAAGTLRYPKYGTRAARVNYQASTNTTTNGANTNVNSLTQQMTAGIGDVDPTDNKVHVRFALAPVLENPAHLYTQQPYYFVRLQNLTRGTTLYQDFNASGQTGVPWKNFTTPAGNAAQYTDWQLVDIAPGNAALAVGDDVELLVIAAGCNQGGHFGRVYVDAVGSGIPGLFTWATGVQNANAGSDVTYTMNYKNGGTTTTAGTQLDLVIPPNTTYQSTTGPGCTAPAVGGTGTVSCTLGSVSPGGTGAYSITVNVNAATANGTVITNGNYSIYATGVSALVGPKVQTTVTSGVTYSDLAITKSDGIAAIGWGQPLTYTIGVANAGPATTTATVTDTMPAQLTGVTWTCVATGTATCAASGSGSISDTVSLAAGGALTYTVHASIVAGTGNGSVINTATVAATGSSTDPDATNNAAVDTDTIGTLRTLTLTKLGTTSAGSISSSPAAISCGPGCSSAAADFLDSSQVQLTATPNSGATFVGWGGACAGTTTTCTVTMAGAQSVTATFAGAPATTAMSSGSPQSATILSAFASPLAVLVSDAGGVPVPGVTVTFAAPGSGASATLSAATAVTNSAGIASVTATASGTAGAYSVTGTITGITPVASFALSNIGVPSTIAVSSGSGQSATVGVGFGASLVAIVRDVANQPVPGVTVTFAAPGSGPRASLSSTTAITNAAGLATITATAGFVAGSYAVTASTSGVATPASFALTNLAGAATTLAVLSGNNQSVRVGTAFAAALVVRISDALDNPVAGVSVTFTPPASGATAALSPTTTTTNASGLAQTTATASNAAGSYTVTASASGLTSAGFALTNTAGLPAAIAISSGNNQSATVRVAFAQALAALVTDSFGNPVPGATVTFTAPGAGASATIGSAVTNASGIASAAVTANAIAGAYTVTAAVTGGGSVGFALTNTAGAAFAVTIIGGQEQSATVGTAFAQPITVRVVDADSNPVVGATITLTGPASGAGLSPSPITITTGAAGTASTTVTANHSAGSYNVSAAVPGVALTPNVLMINTPGAVTTLAVVSGDPQHAGVTAAFASPLVVLATDSFSNPVPSTSVTFTAPASGASASFAPATATTGSNGRATTTATAGTRSGAYTVTASAGAASTTFHLTNDPGAATAIAMASGSPQSAVVAAPFGAPLAVHVTDAQGNDVPGQTVTFAAPGSGARATLAATTATTGATGLAQTTATAGNTAGSYAVTATIAGPHVASFQLTNTADTVATLTATGGGGQSAVVLVAFATPLAIHAADQFGNPVPSATITYAAPSNANATFAGAGVTTTDASGNAQIIATAGTAAGSYVAQAASGAAAPVTFALTNLPGEAAQIAVIDGTPQSATVAMAFAAPLRVRVTDAQGNPVPEATVHFSPASSPASATPSAATAITDGDGVASIGAIANTVAGTYDLTASTGADASVAFTLTNLADVPASITAAEIASPQAITVLQMFTNPLAVTVLDQYGNPAPGATVTYSVPASGASATLSSATATTDGSGNASVLATASATAGSYIALAVVAGVADAAPFALSNLVGAPATLVVSSGDPQTAVVDTDFAAALVVQVLDANNNPVPGVVVAFSAPGDGATAVLTSSSAMTDAGGLASMPAHAGTVTGSYAITASFGGAAAPVTFSLSNAPGAPATITASLGSTPQNAQVDHPFAQPLAAVVRDRFGNTVPGVTVTYAAPGTGATGALSTTTATSGEDGSVSATIDAGTIAGSYTVTATAAGVELPAVFTLGNLAGEAQTIVASAGTPQSATVVSGFAAPIVALVQDAHGNPVPGVTVTFAAPASGATATLAQTTATTDADGTARTELAAATVAGDFVVTATAPAAASPASFALTALAAAPATIAALGAATPQSAAVMTAFGQPLAVTVLDSFGNPVPGVHVTYAAPAAPGAQLSATSATTDDTGTASVLAIADHLTGAYSVTAAVDGTSGATFALTNTAASPSAVLITSGGAQHTLATTAFGAPVAARVIDSFGNPVVGAQVTFSVPGTGASATIASPMQVSDDHGDVSVTLTAGPVVGAFLLSVHVDGAAGAATTLLEALAIPTTITATADAAAPVDAQPQVTISVAAMVGVPTGTVDIVGADGTHYGSATLSAGAAVITTAGLALGTHTLMASYAAQGSYGASTSTAVTIEITGDTGSLSGGSGGCNTGRGSAGGWLVLVLGVLLVRRRRPRATGSTARTIGVGVALCVGLAAGNAVADPDGARAINRYHAASPDSAWFALDSATFAGNGDVALSVVTEYAKDPLETFNGDGTVRQHVVTDTLTLQFGASVTLRDLVRLSASVPLVPWQAGHGGMFNGMPLSTPIYAFGDVVLGGDVRVLGRPRDPLRLALGVRFALPTGSRTNFTSDGTLGTEPHVDVAGSLGMLEYAGAASAFLRSSNAMAGEKFGHELRYEAGAGIKLLDRRLLVGPELFGATALQSDTAVGTPLELQLGAHVAATRELRLGVAVGKGLINAVGEPTWRGLASLVWTP